LAAVWVDDLLVNLTLPGGTDEDAEAKKFLRLVLRDLKWISKLSFFLHTSSSVF
jgi:hypothetical protein